MVTKEYFEPVLDFPFVSALRPSKVHGDRFVEAITVGVPHDVGESFVDRASDRPALDCRESQCLGQTFHRSAYYREQPGIAVQR